VTSRQIVSESGFVIGHFDPKDDRPVITDVMLGESYASALEVVFSKSTTGQQTAATTAAAATAAAAGAAAATAAAKKKGEKVAGDPRPTPPAPNLDDKKRAENYARKREERRRKARSERVGSWRGMGREIGERRLTALMNLDAEVNSKRAVSDRYWSGAGQQPKQGLVADIMPKTRTGKIALAAAVPAAVLAYGNRERLGRQYGRSRDVRRYRPASPYYDRGIGKSDLSDVSKVFGSTERITRKAKKLELKNAATERLAAAEQRKRLKGPVPPSAYENRMAVARDLRSLLPASRTGKIALVAAAPALVAASRINKGVLSSAAGRVGAKVKAVYPAESIKEFRTGLGHKYRGEELYPGTPAKTELKYVEKPDGTTGKRRQRVEVSPAVPEEWGRAQKYGGRKADAKQKAATPTPQERVASVTPADVTAAAMAAGGAYKFLAMRRAAKIAAKNQALREAADRRMMRRAVAYGVPATAAAYGASRMLTPDRVEKGFVGSAMGRNFRSARAARAAAAAPAAPQPKAWDDMNFGEKLVHGSGKAAEAVEGITATMAQTSRNINRSVLDLRKARQGLYTPGPKRPPMTTERKLALAGGALAGGAGYSMYRNNKAKGYQQQLG
jgi:hypothetical protein